jgi:hypothetical protein
MIGGRLVRIESRLAQEIKHEIGTLNVDSKFRIAGQQFNFASNSFQFFTRLAFVLTQFENRRLDAFLENLYDTC